MTVLAWGNSLGDLVADTALARAGNPRMGAAGCFGGPLFNLCIGAGVPMLLASVFGGGHFCLAYERSVPLGVLALLLSQSTSLIVLPLRGFNLDRSFGFFLVIFYAAFMTLSIVFEVAGSGADQTLRNLFVTNAQC
uniref:Sodium/calcium exchanger membrane region domain-containing protein n=1 Tax=Chrysotila carterae TaxID=13221 RepID=A0A7S4B0U4_CHRCT